MKHNTTLEQMLEFDHPAVHMDLKTGILHTGLAQRILGSAIILLTADAISAVRNKGVLEAPGAQKCTWALAGAIDTMETVSESEGKVRVFWHTQDGFNDFGSYLSDAALVHYAQAENALISDPTKFFYASNKVRKVPASLA